MNKKAELQYIKHENIDSVKWNQCIEDAPNCRVYAYAWHLDRTAIIWDALIWGDYEFVMPLPIKSKFGIKYIYQPVYCQQLGIFPNPNFEIQNQFAKYLKDKFLLVNYQINFANNISAFNNFKGVEKVNYILQLSSNYNEISKNFSKHTKRNIKIAHKNQVKIIKGQLPHEYINTKKQAARTVVKASTYQILSGLITGSMATNTGIIYAAYSSTNSLCAAAFIVLNKNRAYYLNAFSTSEGRKERAMYAIIENIIDEYSDSNIFLDFEGSVIEGIARFYKGFGATAENYFYIYSNRLPVIRKFMK